MHICMCVCVSVCVFVYASKYNSIQHTHSTRAAHLKREQILIREHIL